MHAVKDHFDDLAAFILDLQHEGVQVFDIPFLQPERQQDEGGKLSSKHTDRTGAVKIEGLHIAEHGAFGKEHACIIFIRLQIAHTVCLCEVVICEIQMRMEQGFENLWLRIGFIVEFTENRLLLDRIQLDRQDRCVMIFQRFIREALLHLIHDHLAKVIRNGRENSVFIVKQIVDTARGDPGLLYDLANGCLFIPLFQKKSFSGVKNIRTNAHHTFCSCCCLCHDYVPFS